MTALKLVHPAPAFPPGVPRGVLGADEQVIPWVERHLDLPEGHFKGAMAIGIALDGHPIAGVIYQYHKHWQTGLVTVEQSIATISPRWCTRPILFSIFNYPFTHLKAQRLQVACRKSNTKARNLVERLGFKMEGVARRGWDGKQNAVVYSMLPDECRWIRKA